MPQWLTTAVAALVYVKAPAGRRGVANGQRNGRAVTLADVAREAGVSPASASFVLSGRSGSSSSGSPETKKKVRDAAERLGYIPNRSAQAMRTRRGGGIVLALGTLGDPWGIHLGREVRSRALENDLSTLVLTDERWFEYLSGTFPDCSFITSVDFHDNGAEQVRMLAARMAGGIVAFSTVLEPDGFDVISSPPGTAIHRAYARLRSRHESVHFLSTSAIDETTKPRPHSRPAAFRDAALERGDGPLRELILVSPRGSLETYRYSLEMLRGSVHPTAIIASTGYQAVALQNAAHELGLRMPEDLEIISIGDVPERAMYHGPVSYYGVRDVFTRMADVIVGRAMDRSDRPGRLHSFTWEFFSGVTTVD